MRFMVLVKATKDSEAGVLPTREQFAEMGKFNEQLVKDGVMLAGDGLQASSKGARMRFDGGRPTVTDGPFAETKELLAGFWIVQGKSKEEIISRFMSAPFERGEEIEIRQIFEAEDFGDNLPDDVREQEERLRSGAQVKIISIFTLPPANAGDPSQEEMERMGAYITELRGRGVLIDTGGRDNDMFEKIVSRRDGKTTATDGPFTEAKEVVGGYALMDVRDVEEATALDGALPRHHRHRHVPPPRSGADAVLTA